MYAAQKIYESTREMRAFNVPGYSHRAANGAATWYEFQDGSRLTVLKKRNAITWAEGWAALSPLNQSRRTLAIRTLF